MGIVIGLLVVAVVTVAAIAVYNARTGKVLDRLPPDAWGARCIDPRAYRSWRVVIMDDRGIRLVNSRGKLMLSYPWNQMASAGRGELRPGPAVISHIGVVVQLVDGGRFGFLLPGPSTLDYPPELVDTALAQFAHRRSAL